MVRRRLCNQEHRRSGPGSKPWARKIGRRRRGWRQGTRPCGGRTCLGRTRRRTRWSKSWRSCCTWTRGSGRKRCRSPSHTTASTVSLANDLWSVTYQAYEMREMLSERSKICQVGNVGFSSVANAQRFRILRERSQLPDQFYKVFM